MLGASAAWLACALAAMGMAQAQAPAVTETVLHAFANFAPKGSSPYSGVIRDSAGNLYGTTSNGGTASMGVVYRVNPAGQETVLYSFKGGTDGSFPQAGVIGDSTGNLYGATEGGGTANAGVVYKVNQAGQETVLYTFTGGADGSNPYAGSLIRDWAGNLYGTTLDGGSGVGFAGFGVVYKVDTSGKETVLYTFTGGADGGYPTAGVIRDPAGNLYGTATSGGNLSACGGFGCGVVYKLDTSGNETVLYSFTGGADGGDPNAGVIRDAAGDFYGTTYSGGDLSACNGSGCGVVYKLDTSGETVLYTFTGGTDGAYAYAGVIRDESGNLYGTTTNGGDLSACNGSGCGVVYKVDRLGNETVLYTFTGGTDGNSPYAGVIRDEECNLYGTTYSGGPVNLGALYKLDTTSHETVLNAFTSSPDGSGPAYSGVIHDPAGNLYGTTSSGGTADAGVVYKLDPDGHEVVLYTFTGGADGGSPLYGVIPDAAGNLYGTTESGGTGGAGVVFKLDTSWKQTVLYSFTGGTDGSGPSGSLAIDSAGNLYGTAASGGTANHGVVYKLDTLGHETVLYNFTDGADGGDPAGGVVRDAAGNLYGTTIFGGSACCAGVVFKVDMSGNETVLYSFACGAGGCATCRWGANPTPA
jgi:uncharacterized repeat protein (TIGR03803 family)